MNKEKILCTIIAALMEKMGETKIVLTPKQIYNVTHSKEYSSIYSYIDAKTKNIIIIRKDVDDEDSD